MIAKSCNECESRRTIRIRGGPLGISRYSKSRGSKSHAALSMPTGYASFPTVTMAKNAAETWGEWNRGISDSVRGR